MSAVLLHMGNWDLAGTWATKHIAPIHSIAEKLKPAELAEHFLRFRRSIGLTIYQTGGRAINQLEKSMHEEAVVVTLCATRDLSASGVEVVGKQPVQVAVGGALLAQRTGAPMWPISITTEDFAATTPYACAEPAPATGFASSSVGRSGLKPRRMRARKCAQPTS